jgi:hypothetical protein
MYTTKITQDNSRPQLSFLSLLDLLNRQLTIAHFMRGKKGKWLPKKELEGPIYVCDKEQMARLSV